MCPVRREGSRPQGGAKVKRWARIDEVVELFGGTKASWYALHERGQLRDAASRPFGRCLWFNIEKLDRLLEEGIVQPPSPLSPNGSRVAP